MSSQVVGFTEDPKEADSQFEPDNKKQEEFR